MKVCKCCGATYTNKCDYCGYEDINIISITDNKTMSHKTFTSRDLSIEEIRCQKKFFENKWSKLYRKISV